MTIHTNETIIARRLRIIQTKRAKKGKGEGIRMSLLIMTLKALKREKLPLL
jgi:hypothetical protein